MSDISIIVRKMRTFAERNMAHRGIGFPEQLVLMSLLANGESNQESIAAEHGIDRGAITKTLAKLEAKGLVTRKVNSKNKREKIVAQHLRRQASSTRCARRSSSWTTRSLAASPPRRKRAPATS